MSKYLALALASTIRHDGDGGVADDLADVDGLTAWVHEQAAQLGDSARGFIADVAALEQIIALRRAVRALFAHAVRPGPPSRADAGRLLPMPKALKHINHVAAAVPVTLQMRWPGAAAPIAVVLDPESDAVTRMGAAIARDTIGFLSGPDRASLRACTAPRCVRYFLQDHGRQEFCKPTCAARARAARHYQRHKAPTS